MPLVYIRNRVVLLRKVLFIIWVVQEVFVKLKYLGIILYGVLRERFSRGLGHVCKLVVLRLVDLEVIVDVLVVDVLEVEQVESMPNPFGALSGVRHTGRCVLTVQTDVLLKTNAGVENSCRCHVFWDQF